MVINIDKDKIRYIFTNQWRGQEFDIGGMSYDISVHHFQFKFFVLFLVVKLIRYIIIIIF